jgi:hypothetical protein
MPGAESGIEVLHDEGGWRVGLWKNLLFTGISTSPTASSLQLVREGQRRLFEMPGAVGGLTLVTGLRLGPLDLSEAMRTEIGRMMNVPNLRGHSAIVIESEGFAGATVRAVLGAVILLAKPDSPQKLFETRIDAARYLAQHAPAGWTADELVDAADAFTSGLGR